MATMLKPSRLGKGKSLKNIGADKTTLKSFIKMLRETTLRWLYKWFYILTLVTQARNYRGSV